ncbi:hypothetical protein [Pseudomonas sp. UBA2684]|uniref:hypothetical protein n=1 Tax=Pseudomonas sp. UBA2684 TaxID=1947311 RepID=UPI000E9FD15F|nr:hypothetical protein [Pseudomonas sp. UBA2684]HBX54501.1 hypothetical protein [Pseudomonas sp.]|tara:strand:- start:1722 stop:2099 length:378 start_codon:yes stop_codon:yes gene_type:complete
MSRRLPLISVLIAASLCLAASYGLRFSLMESQQWVGLCVEAPQRLACEIRAGLGWLIHLRVLAWAALLSAVLAFVLPGRWGWRLAVPALLLGLPALVLYSASLAAFAVVLALLRLVRAPQPAQAL